MFLNQEINIAPCWTRTYPRKHVFQSSLKGNNWKKQCLVRMFLSLALKCGLRHSPDDWRSCDSPYLIKTSVVRNLNEILVQCGKVERFLVHQGI